MQAQNCCFPTESAIQLALLDQNGIVSRQPEALAISPFCSYADFSELHKRPNLERPWRSAKATKQAAAVCIRETAISELQEQLREVQGNYEVVAKDIDRMYRLCRDGAEKVIQQKENEIVRLTGEVERFRQAAVDKEGACENKLRLRDVEFEAERSALMVRLRRSGEELAEMSTSFVAQIETLKTAASREVLLVSALGEARSGELVEELRSAEERAAAAERRCARVAADAAAEAERIKTIFEKQLEEQVVQFRGMLAAAVAERDESEKRRLEAAAETATARDEVRIFKGHLTQSAACFREWNSRVLTSLERFSQQFIAAARALSQDGLSLPETAPSSRQKLCEAYIPSEFADDVILRSVLERVADLQEQLALTMQQHGRAVDLALRRMRYNDTASQAGANELEKKATEIALEYDRLLVEVQEAQTTQSSLSTAMVDLRDSLLDVRATLSSTFARLAFFSDDLQQAVESALSAVAPPRGDVAFVAVAIEGYEALWRVDAAAMAQATKLFKRVARAKLSEAGGYEAYTGEELLVVVFKLPHEAMRFALELQLWLLLAPWPLALAKHYHSQTELADYPVAAASPSSPAEDGLVTSTKPKKRVVKKSKKGIAEKTVGLAGPGVPPPPAPGTRFALFNGLRPKIGITYGEAGVDEQREPTSRATCRARYYGRVFDEALRLAALASGGMVLVPVSLWECASAEATRTEALAAIDPVATPYRCPDVGEQEDIKVSAPEDIMCVTPKILAPRQCHPSVELSSYLQGCGSELPASFSKARSAVLKAECTVVTNTYDSLVSRLESLLADAEATDSALEDLRSRMRDAQLSAGAAALVVGGRPVTNLVDVLSLQLGGDSSGSGAIQTSFSASGPAALDLCHQARTLDDVQRRVDALARAIREHQKSHEDTVQWGRRLEAALVAYSNRTLFEDEMKRRIAAVQDKASESAVRLQAQCDDAVSSLQATVARLSEENANLKAQMLAPKTPKVTKKIVKKKKVDEKTKPPKKGKIK